MELAYALVVLIRATYRTCEEFLGENCALFGLMVLGVWEVVNGFGEFNVRACVEKLC